MATVPANEWLAPGTSVEVLVRYDASWTSGFVVSSVRGDGYRLRRSSDGATLPKVFGPGEVRPCPERQRHPGRAR